MLVYIEYISRRSGVSLEAFHHVAGRGQETWSGDHAEDALLLNLARTWRIGPDYEALTFWYTANAGLERIDEWERIFTSGAVAAIEEPFKLAARIDYAGCYEPLLEPVAGRRGPFYIEYLDFSPGATREAMRDFFGERREQHRDLILNALLDRIGRLGPEPRALAVWELPSYAHLDGIVRELEGAEEPVRLVNAGLYAPFGREIL